MTLIAARFYCRYSGRVKRSVAALAPPGSTSPVSADAGKRLIIYGVFTVEDIGAAAGVPAITVLRLLTVEDIGAAAGGATITVARILAVKDIGAAAGRAAVTVFRILAAKDIGSAA